MLNVQGYVKVTKIEQEVGKKFAKGIVYYGKSKQDGTYKNSLIRTTFVGKALDEIVNIQDKSPIYIESGIVENVIVNDKSYLSLTVFKIDQSKIKSKVSDLEQIEIEIQDIPF